MSRLANMSFIIVILFSCTTADLIQSTGELQKVTVDLGSRDRAAALFSYPDSCTASKKSNCDWTLSETIHHYLNASTWRDGYHDATITVDDSTNEVTVTIQNVPADYGEKLTAFLDIGDKALSAGEKLKDAGIWKKSWYSFLMLGMPLRNRRTVQLLNFPPDYALTENQDYLNAKTTNRWASLLEENGIKEADIPSFQAVIDIAPIAAPANESVVDPDFHLTYAYYSDYTKSMVNLWTECDECQSKSHPMVVFGKPAHDWVNKEYGVDLYILGLGTIKLDGPGAGRSVPVLGANHPSRIWYAADPKTYNGNVIEADKVGLQVMEQDIVAACWQSQIGLYPNAIPENVLTWCKEETTIDNSLVCKQFYASIRGLSMAEADKKCGLHEEL